MTTIADFKIGGLWQKSQPGNGDVKTEAYQTYNDIVKRTKAGGKYQTKYPTYIGTQNGFGDFQHFADWAVQEIGYAVPGFELDKDLLVPGNKTYSPETCCFLPAQINTALQRDRLNKKSNYPVGVRRNNKNGLKAQIRIDGKEVHLASTPTSTPEDIAHLVQVYTKAKSAYLNALAIRYQHSIDPRAFQALMEL